LKNGQRGMRKQRTKVNLEGGDNRGAGNYGSGRIHGAILDKYREASLS